jgi:2-iminobutanoate/2-iminopropanoate deaminase
MIRIATLCVATTLIFSSNASANDDDSSQGRNGQQLQKEALINPEAPDFTSIFNWGLRIKNIKELILFAGHAAQTPDFQVVAPGDAVVQTDFILDQLDHFLDSNGLERDDIIRIEFTLTKNVSGEQFNQILGRFVAYFADVEVRPAAGTLRYVDALAFPGLEVEYEIWMAQ